MQVPGFLVAVLVLGGLLWTSYFHALWYGSRLELVGGYSCSDKVQHIITDFPFELYHSIVVCIPLSSEIVWFSRFLLPKL